MIFSLFTPSLECRDLVRSNVCAAARFPENEPRPLLAASAKSRTPGLRTLRHEPHNSADKSPRIAASLSAKLCHCRGSIPVAATNENMGSMHALCQFAYIEAAHVNRCQWSHDTRVTGGNKAAFAVDPCCSEEVAAPYAWFAVISEFATEGPASIDLRRTRWTAKRSLATSACRQILVHENNPAKFCN